MMAGKGFTKPGAEVSDLDAASHDRMADAKALVAANRPSAAIVAGLYALEIRLKVLICKNLDLTQLPAAVQFHDLEELLVLAGLSQRIKDPSLIAVRQLWENEILPLSKELNDLRYLPDSTRSLSEARNVLDWLGHPTDGVLTWLLTLS